MRASMGFARVLLGTRSVKVREAVTQADREDTRRLRHEVYCVEKGFLEPDAVFDAYDDRATILNAYHAGEPVGTMRVTDSAEGVLEIFEMHPELASLVPAGMRLVEVSRLMVLKRARGLHATMPLFRRNFTIARARKVDGVIVSCAAPLIPYYRDLLGFQLLTPHPLEHKRLRGLVDYAMILDLGYAFSHVKVRHLPAWFSIHPLECLRAIALTLACKLAVPIPAKLVGCSRGP